jgi:RNA polymerase sigma factor (sigma-70 family)
MVEQAASPGGEPPETGEFERFFRANYRGVVRVVMYAGATQHEAEDAAQEAFIDVYRKWDAIKNPLAYACRAAVTLFISRKKRGLPRVIKRLLEYGEGRQEGAEDPDLNMWAGREWVRELLDFLPKGQRDTLALILDGYTPPQIAELLGKKPATVRRSLCSARRRLKEDLRRKREEER